jgi:hypothetical protein
MGSGDRPSLVPDGEEWKVKLGRLIITANAESTLPPVAVILAIDRHAHCDWGDVSAEDREANENALRDGGRLLSVYHTKAGTRFWIITEADRSATTVLLTEDY